MRTTYRIDLTTNPDREWVSQTRVNTKREAVDEATKYRTRGFWVRIVVEGGVTPHNAMPNSDVLAPINPPEARPLSGETPAEDIRNALTILTLLRMTLGGNRVFPDADYEAVCARLNAAVRKLEGTSCSQCGATMESSPSGNREQCPTCGWSRASLAR